MEYLQTYMQLFLQAANVVIILYALKSFLVRPHDTLEKRVDAHDVEIKDNKSSLKQVNDRFREQDDANEVIIKSVLALIEFEVQYCLLEHKDMSAGLENARVDLNKYLAKR